MADVKITALTAISANPVNPATFPMPMVDLLDNTITASGTTKKVTVNQILGSGGTATLASATITGAATVGTTLGVTGVSTLASAVVTGDLTVDTSTLKVDATNDRVGIGTATPIAGSKLDVRSAIGTGTDIQSLAVIDTSPLAINNGGGLSMGYVFQAPSTVIGRAGYIKTIKENATDNNYASAMVFGVTANGVATAERMRIDSTGNVKIANGNVVMTTSGTGIDFSAVTGGTGTATANVLNDYEEGTFTPTVIGTTIAGTIGTYYANTGRYTKVGRLVTVQVYLAWGGGTGATGDLAFAGLPFTTGNIANNYTSGTIGYFSNIALTASNFPLLFASPNSISFLLYQSPVGGGAISTVPYDDNGGIMFTATYFTA